MTHQPWHKRISSEPLKLAVLVSGGGRTLVNLMEKIQLGELNAQVVKVIASNASSQSKLAQRGVAQSVEVASRKAFDSTQAFSDHIFAQCREAGAELVCLAGFLSLLRIPEDFALRVVNIHPALLPAFGGQGMYGHHVHEAVIEHGCKVSGCTVHFADNTYDTGPILVQRTCEVLPDDDADALAARVFEQECIAYPQAIALLEAGRVEVIDNRRTHVHAAGRGR